MFRTATKSSAVAVSVMAAALASATPAACGFADVFASAGVRDLRFAWASDTVLRVDQAVPIRVTVSIGGAVVDNPRIVVTVPDTMNIAINAAGDSLVGRRAGRGVVMVQLVTSLTAGQPADTAFEIRVTGGGPPAP